MLRLLLQNHYNKNNDFIKAFNILRRPSEISSVKRNLVTSLRKSYYKEIGENIRNIIGRNCKKTNKTISSSSCPNKLKLSSFLLTSCCGITLGAITRRNVLVSCEASQLTVFTKNINKDVKFDWEKFWSYLQPYTWEFIAAVFAAIAVAFFNIKIPSVLGDLINILAKYTNAFVKDPQSNTFFKDIRKPALSLCTMYIFQAGFTFLYILLLSKVGEQMAAKIRQDLFKKIIIQDLEFFDKNRTGELLNRVTADVQDFKSCFKQIVSQGLRCFAQLTGGAISLFFISPHMACIALASVPAVVAFMSLLGRTLRKLSKKAQNQAERATAVCEEGFSNIRAVRSNAAEFREIEHFKEETDLAAAFAEQLGYGIAVFQALTNFFLNGLVLSTLFLGGRLMSTDSLSPGQLMAFLVASQNVQRSLSQGSLLFGTMIRGLTAGSRIFDYLSIDPKVNILKGVTIPKNELKGEIQFINVSFSYPSRSEQEILTNFNLTLKPGQTVALVGSSGSGKSTIASLLERFYEPNSGVITIDGYNLHDIQPYWLRSEVIGFIEQQPTLFATTILDNIRYGKPDATIEEIIESAELSQSHKFIIGLPKSYETNVGEGGSQLSGGQKQRVAIARALIKKPIILILDEATSALDATSEAIVQKSLDTAMTNTTTLVIAHRLSTIRNADLIVVLDGGKIVEMGKHDELLKKEGHYYELVKQQEKKEKELVTVTENDSNNNNPNYDDSSPSKN